MGDYFKPMRRKIGLATLGLACALTAAWVRSFSVTDSFVVYSSVFVSRTDKHEVTNTTEFVSKNGQYIFRILQSPSYEHRSTLDGEVTILVNKPLEISRTRHNYSNVAIPLALISALFLLTKPRTKPAPKPESAHA
jgi:hypothetical protein